MNINELHKGKGQKLYQKARTIIPGGTQLLGKRAEMYLPEQWPSYYSKAKGCEIWDLNGRKFTDCSMVGIGTSVLGYSDPEVNAAVIGAVRNGSMTTLNPPEEVELAELLCDLHPWAEMVRYARTGGEVMAMTVRIARAATGRDKIAFCGYHGWHDWYISSNLAEDKALDGHLLPGLEPLGVPRGLKDTMLPFRFNHLEDLQHIISEHGQSLAAIVMEPCRDEGPAPGFLESVRNLATQVGAVLIFDEVTSGWRMATSGMHMIYGVYPDLVAFGKTMSNGIAMAAVIGRAEIMDFAQRTFISSSYWTERLGPTAAIATLTKHRRENIGQYLTEVGTQVQRAWKKIALQEGLIIKVSGIPPLASFSLEYDNKPALLTLFIQEMLDRKILASDRFYANFCHKERHLKQYFKALHEVFHILSDALLKDDVEARLRGPVKHMGFKRLT
ncbi:MAG: aminotransferase class III-fold pyridoxal phosphate-dependent enzyme [Bacteroidetes bacterium]|nr:aminotransferase class III-fold pyridoxal phosphate-dependent enzyme [Bacteroidota bacterium]